jgi:protease PrsW
MLQLTGHADALALAVIIAVIYLAIVRFLDLNEKEPLWAVALLFFIGAMAAFFLNLVVSTRTLDFTTFEGALAESIGLFIAIAIGVAALTAIGQVRGWSEINGLMDGIVYGAAGGLGFATGQVFVQELLVPDMGFPGLEPGPFAKLWTTALSGLAQGLFGAIIGAGFGLAAQARSSGERMGYPIVGLIAGFLVNVGYRVLAYDAALRGSEGLVRRWVALILPLIFVVGVALYALTREKHAIEQQLADEAQAGVVTADELALLRSFPGRQARYFQELAKGNFAGWMALRELHNRQVMLALAEMRLARETDAERRTEIEGEVARLREGVLEMKRAATTEGARAS